VIPNADIYEIIHGVHEHDFNTKDGPLWAVKYIPWSEKHNDFIKATICKGQDRETPKFENYSHFVFYFCHSNADGYSCVRIHRTLMTLLDGVIAQTSVDETKQVAKFIDTDWEKNIRHHIECELQQNPSTLKQRAKYYQSCFTETLLEKAYPVDPNIKPRTLSLFQIFDEISTGKFIAKCKLEGVTVHCAFSTLIEVAMVKVIIDGGILQESYRVTGLHCADNRSYFDCEKSEDEFGISISLIDKSTVFSSSALTNFWPEVKKFQMEFKERYSMKAGLQLATIDKLTGNGPTMKALNINGQNKPSSSMCYYCTTNMRDLTEILGNSGEHVNLEFINCLSTMTTFPVLFISSFHTLTGKLSHSLQYNAHVIDCKTANKINDAIFQLFNDVV